MGTRFHKARYDGNITIKNWVGNTPTCMQKLYNRRDRRKLNRLAKENPDAIPTRWSHRHWGFWLWA
jgi:hypothetical protein